MDRRPSLETGRGDRRHHFVPKHLQPVGDDAAGPAGRNGGGAVWPPSRLSDQPGAGLACRHRVSRTGRADGATRRSSVFKCGGVRMHHLHRQQRPPAAKSLRSSTRRAWSHGGLSGNRNFEGVIHRTCAPVTWHPRRLSWPTPWPDTTDLDLRPTNPRDGPRWRSGLPSRSVGRHRPRSSMCIESTLLTRDLSSRYAEVFDGNPLERHPGLRVASCSTGRRTQPTSRSRRSSWTSGAGF